VNSFSACCGPDIVVARQGRLADLIGQGQCHLGDVGAVVLDEADQMADVGFVPVVRRLLEATPPDGHRLLFPATLDGEVDVLARRFLARPAPAAGRGAVAGSGGFRSRRGQGRRG
jgi:superfamily II DNA/RNA helicase